MNKLIKKGKLISRNILADTVYCSRFNTLYFHEKRILSRADFENLIIFPFVSRDFYRKKRHIGVFLFLRFDTVQHTWEWNSFTDVFCSCREGDHTLDTDTKSTVWYSTVFTKVEVKFILCTIHAKFIHLSN